MIHTDYPFDINIISFACNLGHSLGGKHIFWAPHLQEHGDVYGILLSDKLSANKGL